MTPSRRRRRGLTIVELLVATALAGVVAAAAAAVTARQARGFAALAARGRVDDEAHLALAVAAIARWAAPGDLALVSDSTLELRAFVGASVACLDIGSTTVLLDAPGSPSASWLGIPRVGDLLLADGGSTPDTNAHVVTAVDERSGACATPRSPQATRYLLALDTPLPAATSGPVRLLRDTRLSLYQSGDRLWYLGLSERGATAWATVQPISGPYSAPSAARPAGLRFLALDSAGARASDPLETRAILVTATAVSDAREWQATPQAVTAVVALRNTGSRTLP